MRAAAAGETDGRPRRPDGRPDGPAGRRRRTAGALASALSPVALVLALVAVPVGADTARAAGTPVEVVLAGTAQVVVGDVPAPDPALPGPRPDAAGAVEPGHVTATLARIDGVDVPLPPGTAPDAAPGDPLRLRVSAPYGMSRDDVVDALADDPAALSTDTAGTPSDSSAPSGAGTTATSSPSEPRVLSVGTVTPLATTAAGAVAERHTSIPTTGTHTVTVLPVSWTTPDATVEQLTTLAQTSAAYWQNQSGGRMTVPVTVRPWQQVSTSAALESCDFMAILAAAKAANPGVSESATDHLVIYFPRTATCGWAGLGYIGWGVTWDNGYLLPDVTSHELGHNLGLGHANALQCVDPDSWQISLSDTCTPYEYYDSSDVMGYAWSGRPTGSANAAEADYLRFLTSVDVDPAGLTDPLTVDLAPMTQPTALRALRIALPARAPLRPAGTTMYVEYRTATGADARRPEWAGVQARLSIPGLADPLGSPWTQLLTLRPTTSSTIAVGSWSATGWVNPTLPVGVRWTVPDTDLTLEVLSQDAASARVRVSSSAAPAPASTPTLAVTGATSGWVRGATAVAVTSDTRYRTVLLVDGVLKQTLAAGDTGRTVSLGLLPDGTHTVTARSLSSGGAVLTSASTTVKVDRTAPTAPGSVSVRQTTNATRTAVAGLRVTWTASTDARSGVAGYRVTVDGGWSATTTGTALTVPANRLSPLAGRHDVRVTATDRAGNATSVTRSVTVDATAATAPRMTATVLDARHVRITWAPAVDRQSGVAGYQVLRAGSVYGVRVAHVGGRDVYSAKVTVPVGTTALAVRVTNRVGLVRTATVRVTTR